MTALPDEVATGILTWDIASLIGDGSGGVQQGTGTIQDDDTAPTFTISALATTLCETDNPIQITVTLSAPSGLPATVTLDDSMSMMPAMKLSKFPQVVVGARVSKSGNAMPQSGDLQTLSPPIESSRSEPIALTIDQIVP